MRILLETSSEHILYFQERKKLGVLKSVPVMDQEQNQRSGGSSQRPEQENQHHLGGQHPSPYRRAPLDPNQSIAMSTTARPLGGQHQNFQANAQQVGPHGNQQIPGYPHQPLPGMMPSHFPPTNSFGVGPTAGGQLGHPQLGHPSQSYQPQPQPQSQSQPSFGYLPQMTTNVPQQFATMQTPHIPLIPTRVSADRPIVKLSLGLIDTYKRINDRYYNDQTNNTPRTTRPEPGSRGGVRNNGWDDEHYDYIIKRGELIGNRYEIQERIGKGSFGQVVRAYDTAKKEVVAIKIIKSKAPFLAQAGTEIDILTHLKRKDPQDQNNIVKLLSTFMHRQHQCLVFEMLSLNLYELLKNTQFEGVSLNLIRKFAKQILKSLQFLKHRDVDVIHCDLKPENILLRHPKRSGVKVIDFGSSCLSNNQMYSYIQSRFYRSPEVLLSLPYSTAIDMWSLGCILVEMHTGEPLFSGQDPVDQMQKIVKILGIVPHDVIESMEDEKRKDYNFERSLDGSWVLGRKKDQNERIVPSTDPKTSLKEIFRNKKGSTEVQKNINEYDIFIDLIYKMLTFRPDERIKPDDALRHPFIFTAEHSSRTIVGSSA